MRGYRCIILCCTFFSVRKNSAGGLFYYHIIRLHSITNYRSFNFLIYKKKVGGFTGDAIGMAVELGELTYLIIIVEFLIRVYP